MEKKTRNICIAGLSAVAAGAIGIAAYKRSQKVKSNTKEYIENMNENEDVFEGENPKVKKRNYISLGKK